MSLKFRCVIVDDEFLVIWLVENYIKKVFFLELVYIMIKFLEVIVYMEWYDFDLIFLDI